MTATTDIYSYRDFLDFVDEQHKAHQLDGIIVMESPAAFRHEELQSFLAALITLFVSERELGTVYGGQAAYKLDERSRYFDSRVLPGFRVDTRWFWMDPLPKPAAILRKLLK
jgi:Uma2 family endonuclease